MTASSSVEGSMGAENPCKNAARQLQQLPPHIRRMCLGVCRVCFSFGRAHERTPAEQRMWGVRRGGSCILAFCRRLFCYLVWPAESQAAPSHNFCKHCDSVPVARVGDVGAFCDRNVDIVFPVALVPAFGLARANSTVTLYGRESKSATWSGRLALGERDSVIFIGAGCPFSTTPEGAFLCVT